MFGGTLNGNAGPVLGDLLLLLHDRINETLTVRAAKIASEDAAAQSIDGQSPGPRRGYPAAPFRSTPSPSHIEVWETSDDSFATTAMRRLRPLRPQA